MSKCVLIERCAIGSNILKGASHHCETQSYSQRSPNFIEQHFGESLSPNFCAALPSTYIQTTCAKKLCSGVSLLSSQHTCTLYTCKRGHRRLKNRDFCRKDRPPYFVDCPPFFRFLQNKNFGVFKKTSVQNNFTYGTYIGT